MKTNVYVLNRDLDVIGIIDEYSSLIWTEKYYEAGDFELYLPASSSMWNLLKPDYYISIMESNTLMIIEKRKIEYSGDEGLYLAVSGRCLKSILQRRIAWGSYSLQGGNFQNYIHNFLNWSIIQPSNTNRKINNFIFLENSDPRVTIQTLTGQYVGTNLYALISEECKERNLGFSVDITDDGQFRFKLYSGVDRSFAQSTNDYVIFSRSFENLRSSEYEEDKTDLYNTAYIGGEGEGKDRTFTYYGNMKGLDRREIFVDSSSISSNVNGDNQQAISTSQYISLLRSSGRAELGKHTTSNEISVEIENQGNYVLGRDYFLGDFVQIVDDYAGQIKALVSEITYTFGTDEISLYPTLTLQEGIDIPSAYQEVEYVKSTGTQWVDLQITPDPSTTIETEFKIELNSIPNSFTYSILGVFTDADEDAKAQCGLTKEAGLNPAFMTSGGFGYQPLTFSNNTWTFTVGQAINTPSGDLYLFAQNNTNGASAGAVNIGGIKYVKKILVRQSGEILANFIPCYRKSDNKVGLYDNVRNLFLQSQVGSLEKGPNVQ